jgi:hypothetical protein
MARIRAKYARLQGTVQGAPESMSAFWEVAVVSHSPNLEIESDEIKQPT